MDCTMTASFLVGQNFFGQKFQSPQKSPFATTEFLSEKQWSMREKSGDKEKRYLELWNRVEAEMEKPKVGIKTTQIAVLLWSGSGQIGIMLADPDPYLFQPNVMRNYTILFPKNFKILSEILKTMKAGEKNKTLNWHWHS
jgi:hypothetical protein